MSEANEYFGSTERKESSGIYTKPALDTQEFAEPFISLCPRLENVDGVVPHLRGNAVRSVNLAG